MIFILCEFDIQIDWWDRFCSNFLIDRYFIILHGTQTWRLRHTFLKYPVLNLKLFFSQACTHCANAACTWPRRTSRWPSPRSCRRTRRRTCPSRSSSSRRRAVPCHWICHFSWWLQYYVCCPVPSVFLQGIVILMNYIFPIVQRLCKYASHVSICPSLFFLRITKSTSIYIKWKCFSKISKRVSTQLCFSHLPAWNRLNSE